jgi:hypothetical protein
MKYGKKFGYRERPEFIEHISNASKEVQEHYYKETAEIKDIYFKSLTEAEQSYKLIQNYLYAAMNKALSSARVKYMGAE